MTVRFLHRPATRRFQCYNLVVRAGDWISIIALVFSVAAFRVSLVHRRAEIERQEATSVRARVWEILNGEAGLRSINALDVDDDKTTTRIRLLERTATQLGVAGASELGTALNAVVAEPWGSETSDQSRRVRVDFHNAAAEFMRPSEQQ